MNDFKEKVNELKALLHVTTDAELADKMGVKLPTISTWKQRGLSKEAQLAFSKIKHQLIQNERHCVAPTLHLTTVTATKLSPHVSAGNGSNIESIDSVEKMGEFILDVCTFKTPPPKNLYAMQVDGYSMTPMIFPDSWVVFDDTTHFKGDGLYIINWRNVLMVKLLQVNSEGMFRIISVNKEYESYTIKEDDQSVFKIFGKVLRTII